MLQLASVAFQKDQVYRNKEDRRDSDNRTEILCGATIEAALRVTPGPSICVSVCFCTMTTINSKTENKAVQTHRRDYPR